MTTRRAEFMILMVTLVAAAGWVFSKIALRDFAAHSFIAIRFLVASWVLMLFCRKDLMALSWDAVRRSLLTGSVMGVALSVWVLALQRTDHVGEGAFIVSMSIVVVPVIGRLFFGDRITLWLLFCFLPAIAGLALLSLENGFRFNQSQLLFLMATVGFALHLNLSSHFVKNIPPLPLASLQLLMVGLLASGLAVWFDAGFLSGPIWAMPVSVWGWLLCSALIATSLRFALQTEALQYISPSHASMIYLAEPVWTALLSALVFSERMSGSQLMGCVLIFAAVVLFRFKKGTRD